MEDKIKSVRYYQGEFTLFYKETFKPEDNINGTVGAYLYRPRTRTYHKCCTRSDGYDNNIWLKTDHPPPEFKAYILLLGI